MKRTALLIDGGYLRAALQNANLPRFDAGIVEVIARSAFDDDEEIYRIMYYDSRQYEGVQKYPISGDKEEFRKSERNEHYFYDLAQLDFFAVRLGVLQFRGWVLRDAYFDGQGRAPTDQDFKPNFVQKGVDMRFGLDIAVLEQTNSVERIILMVSDTDYIPAIKHGRKSGLQTVLASLPDHKEINALWPHFDIIRTMKWPGSIKRDA